MNSFNITYHIFQFLNDILETIISDLIVKSPIILGFDRNQFRSDRFGSLLKLV